MNLLEQIYESYLVNDVTSFAALSRLLVRQIPHIYTSARVRHSPRRAEFDRVSSMDCSFDHVSDGRVLENLRNQTLQGDNRPRGSLHLIECQRDTVAACSRRRSHVRSQRFW